MLTFSAADSKHVDGKTKTKISEETPSKDRKKHSGKSHKVTKLREIFNLAERFSDSSSRSHKKKKSKDKDRERSKVSRLDVLSCEDIL